MLSKVGIVFADEVNFNFVKIDDDFTILLLGNIKLPLVFIVPFRNSHSELKNDNSGLSGNQLPDFSVLSLFV